jgi:hypothetical protein
MTRRLLFAGSILVCLASSACQTYTSGVQQGVTRVDETVAIAALRSINTAQKTYSLSTGGSYGTFEELVQGGYLDTRFNSSKPVFKDYVLTIAVTPKPDGAAEGSYHCNADPQASGNRVGRHFYIDSTAAEIHVNETQPATAADPPLQP